MNAINRRQMLSGAVATGALVAAAPAWADPGTVEAVLGDGVTDNHAAIQAALEAVADGGGVVSLPAGEVFVSESLFLPDGSGDVVLEGGEEGTLLRGGDNGILCDMGRYDGDDAVVLRGLIIESASPGDGSLVGERGVVMGVGSLVIADCTFTDENGEVVLTIEGEVTIRVD